MIPTSKECRAALLAVYKTNENLSADPYGTRIPIGSLVSLTIARMNVSPSEFTKAAEKIRAHIQFSAKGDKSIFIVARGKGGGVSLREGTRL